MLVRESQKHIAEAERYENERKPAEARSEYLQAARLQHEFFDELPSTRAKTKSVYGLSAATLYYRANDHVSAANMVNALLSQDWLDPYTAAKVQKLRAQISPPPNPATRIIKAILEFLKALVTKPDPERASMTSARTTIVDSSAPGDKNAMSAAVSALDFETLEKTVAMFTHASTGLTDPPGVKALLGEIKRELIQIQLLINPDASAHIATAIAVIDDPTTEIKHKLKVTIPIIPFVLTYEGELGLKASANLKSLYEGLKNKLNPTDEPPPPVHDTQSPAVFVFGTRRPAVLVFGIVFIVAVMVLAVVFPNPTLFQYNVFRIVISLASAGTAAMFLGFIKVNIITWVRAAGALAVFVLVYFYNPAQPPVPLPKAMLLGITPQTYKKLGLTEGRIFPNRYLAEMVTLLQPAKPRAIVLDFIFSSEQAHEEDNAALKSALAAESNVRIVLPYVPNGSKEYRLPQNVLPINPDGSPPHNIVLGHASPKQYSNSNLLYGVPLLDDFGGEKQPVPHIALAAVMADAPNPVQNLRFDNKNTVTDGHTQWPVQSDCDLVVDFSSKLEPPLALDFGDILNELRIGGRSAEKARSLFTNNIVIIGDQTGRDTHPTPNGEMAGFQFVGKVVQQLLQTGTPVH